MNVAGTNHFSRPGAIPRHEDLAAWRRPATKSGEDATRAPLAAKHFPPPIVKLLFHFGASAGHRIIPRLVNAVAGVRAAALTFGFEREHYRVESVAPPRWLIVRTRFSAMTTSRHNMAGRQPGGRFRPPPSAKVSFLHIRPISMQTAWLRSCAVRCRWRMR